MHTNVPTRTRPKTCLRNPPLFVVINIRKKHGKAGRDRQDKALVHVETGLSLLLLDRERLGEEDGGGQTANGGGCMISRWEGRNTHTIHRAHGGAKRLCGWLTAETDWLNWMASKTAVPFPCIGLQGARDQHV